MAAKIRGLLPVTTGEIGPDAVTAPFFAACREHRFVVPRCTSCGTYRFPPSAFCPNCNSTEVEWAESTGFATLYSFTIVRHPVIPEMLDYVPYVIAVVDIEGMPGARVVTNVVDCDPDSLRVGDRLEVWWHDCSPEVTIPRFTPA
jgi:uncharacterized OB-fold protein